MSREMKDSGIAWIGEIPKGWKVELIGNQVKEVCCPNIDCKENNALQFKMGSIISKSKGNSKYTPETLEGYNVVDKGVIMLNGLNLSFDFISQRIGLVKERGVITSTYIAIKPTNSIDSEFLTYLFKAYDNCKVFHSMGKGLRQTLSYGELKKYQLLYPNIKEQQKIAEFLDRKCGEIDELVALQEKMIDELKAYKQSVITEAVTKGLNPNAPMKDSGIEWIGEIPEHWEVVQTRRIVYSHLQGYYDSDGYSYSGYRLLRITDLLGNGNLTLKNAPFVKETPKIGDFILKQGDFCFARTGGAGNFGFVSEDIEPAVFASYLIRFRFMGQSNNYLHYYFLSSCFLSEVYSSIHGGVNQNIHADNIKNTHISIPPLSEQQQIADYLDKKCADIDELVAVKQQKIDSLKEYKKSLIYEYVTGKKEVI